VPFLKDGSFDPETVHAMGDAFDRARKLLHDRGQPSVVQEIIAKRIIEIARTGERDADKMCKRVLTAFGIDRTD
jgi:glyoxylate carboligase